MDAMVKKSQMWLNSNYGSYGYDRFPTVTEDGQTGWGTINGLIRALQIELGIQETADNFGDGTISKFKQRYPNGVVPQEDNDKTLNNVYGIIQCGLWCKGYSTGASEITKFFRSGTAAGVMELKEDAGINATNGTVTLNVMKALLSMDQFKVLSDYGGTVQIAAIQRTLNSKYEEYIGLSPCDGLYGRKMNDSMIKVLQAIEGYSVEDATGNFGDGTKANLIHILLPSSGNSEAVFLARYALVCNGYDVNILSSTWDSALAAKITEFQNDLALPETGTVDVNTWMSLLLSKGNPDRGSLACDTRFEMTTGRLQYILSQGHQIVGRYLTGGDFKELRMGEPQRILSAGVQFFPIFQESPGSIEAALEYFTEQNGRRDAETAVHQANVHGIPNGNVIFFAVDFDATEDMIDSTVLPYFDALKDKMDSLGSPYKIGVYGTRATSRAVISNHYAITSFVSDMSTGYSGNMGYRIPDNWTYDQFHEYSVDNWDLDKVAYSGQYPAVSSVLSNPTFVEAATRNIRDGDTYTYLGSLKQFTSGSGRGFRVLATGMRVHADYFSNNTSGVGELELVCASTGETLGFISVPNGGTSEVHFSVVYGEVYYFRYTSKVPGMGLTPGNFDVWITTDYLI